MIIFESRTLKIVEEIFCF